MRGLRPHDPLSKDVNAVADCNDRDTNTGIESTEPHPYARLTVHLWVVRGGEDQWDSSSGPEEGPVRGDRGRRRARPGPETAAQAWRRLDPSSAVPRDSW